MHKNGQDEVGRGQPALTDALAEGGAAAVAAGPGGQVLLVLAVGVWWVWEDKVSVWCIYLRASPVAGRSAVTLAADADALATSVSRAALRCVRGCCWLTHLRLHHRGTLGHSSLQCICVHTPKKQNTSESDKRVSVGLHPPTQRDPAH